jgi:hypothetical protein
MSFPHLILWMLYFGGALFFILKVTDDIRENKDRDPNLDAVKSVGIGRVLIGIFVVLGSFFWPIFAARTALWWCGDRLTRLADKLDEKAKELESRDHG